MGEDYHFNAVCSAIDYIEDNICGPIKVFDVCSIVHISPWQFQRIFRAVLGDSIGNYIRGRRLTLAAQCLQQDKKMGILDISIQFQFSSQETFTRAFKKMFKVTPAKFRENPPFRIVFSKPKLNRDKIYQIKNKYSKEPTFKSLEAKKLVGLPLEVISPLGIEAWPGPNILGHWELFNKRRKEISDQVHGFSYGVISSSDFKMEDERLTYISAVEVGPFESLPDQMQRVELPKAEYALFEIKNSDRLRHVIVDYIYGIWLPQADYERVPGPDFEFFTHEQFRLGDPNSISHYCLPIKSK